jgi:PilZ domain
MERRDNSRNRILKTGAIEFNGGAIDCVIRNISDSGAALDVASPVGIPDHFTLAILPDGSRHECRVAWRKEKRIGVAFGKH